MEYDAFNAKYDGVRESMNNKTAEMEEIYEKKVEAESRLSRSVRKKRVRRDHFIPSNRFSVSVMVTLLPLYASI